MKKRIAGWILLALGSLGLLANAIFWLPNVTIWDFGALLFNSLICVVLVIMGMVLIAKGKRKIANHSGVKRYA